MKKIELIIIGNEILNGKVQDSNSHWLARYLSKKGTVLQQVTIVGDVSKELELALNQAYERSDIVVTSGGLGPTQDDITKSTVAKYFKVDLVDSDIAMQIVTKNYQLFEKIPEFTQNGYAQIPKGFTPIANPCGLAPGLFLANHSLKKFFMALPGVPQEFREMFEHNLFPLIEKSIEQSGPSKSQFTARTKGIPEELLFFKLCPTLWDDLSKFGIVSSLPHPTGVDICVNFFWNTPEEKKEIEFRIEEELYKTKVGAAIWQIGALSPEAYLYKLLEERQLKICTAESCTGGLVSSRFTDLPGSSQFHMGGIVSYSNEAKQDLLHVAEKTLINHGAVSLETAEEMARGARKALHADIAISLTGIAGPSGATLQKPVGTVAIGLSTENKTTSQIFKFIGDRTRIKQCSADTAFYIMIEAVKEF